jgi:hypothetical protein
MNSEHPALYGREGVVLVVDYSILFYSLFSIVLGNIEPRLRDEMIEPSREHISYINGT